MVDDLISGQAVVWSLGWRSQVALALALVAGVVAAWGWVPGPPRRPRTGAEPMLPQRHWRRRARAWWGWARGRPDGIGVRLRTLLAVPAATTVAVGAQTFGTPWWVAWLAAATAAGIGWVALGRVEGDEHRQHRRRLVEDLPATCDLLAVCLDAGLPLRRACAVVAEVMRGPVAVDLGRVQALVMAGVHEPEAWRSLADSPPWRRLVTDLARSVESGTGVAGLLHHHAEDARTAAEVAREVRARAAGVRSVLPLMVCFLPAFFLVGVVPLVASLVLRLVG